MSSHFAGLTRRIERTNPDRPTQTNTPGRSIPEWRIAFNRVARITANTARPRLFFFVNTYGNSAQFTCSHSDLCRSIVLWVCYYSAGFTDERSWISFWGDVKVASETAFALHFDCRNGGDTPGWGGG